jgi:hypothetical protein
MKTIKILFEDEPHNFSDSEDKYTVFVGKDFIDCNNIDIEKFNTQVSNGTLSKKHIKMLIEEIITLYECGEVVRLLISLNNPEIYNVNDAITKMKDVDYLKECYLKKYEEGEFKPHFHVDTYKWGKYYVVWCGVEN